MAYQGFRERLHGHNYTVEVHLNGETSDEGLSALNHDGYLIDFGDVKKATKDACNSLNETFILPGESDVLEIKRVGNSSFKSHEDAMEYQSIENKDNTSIPKKIVTSERLLTSRNIEIRCPRDGAFFSFPENDCKVLPIAHSTAEELAQFLWNDILIRLGGASYLRDERGVKEMSIFVAERPTQRARYRQLILTGISDLDVEDVTKNTASNRRDTRVRHSSGKELEETNIRIPSTLDGSDIISSVQSNDATPVASLSKTLNQNKECHFEFASPNRVADYDHISPIISAYRTILETVGEDPNRSGILNTPLRASKTIWGMTSGSRMDLSMVVNGALFDIGEDQKSSDMANIQHDVTIQKSSSLIIVTDIRIHSTCEHHLLPFFGWAHVAVLPNPPDSRRVLGLSKYARIVDMFAKRLQVQERLTDQICQGIWDAYSLNINDNQSIKRNIQSKIIENKMPGCLGVAVSITDCHHLCMSCRGVEKQAAKTHTSSYQGAFQDIGSKEDRVRAMQLRAEFREQLKISRVAGRHIY